jgi:hypothetical protein
VLHALQTGKRRFDVSADVLPAVICAVYFRHCSIVRSLQLGSASREASQEGGQPLLRVARQSTSASESLAAGAVDISWIATRTSCQCYNPPALNGAFCPHT